MTEDEARKKMCHRTLGTTEQAHCIASDCMAWREFKGGMMRDGGFEPTEGGYCGLAGKP